VLSLALTVPILLYDSVIVLSWVRELHGNDYGKFYYAMQAWWHGGSLYAPNIATRMQVEGEWHDYLNMNPPHFHLVVWPFAQLPMALSAYLWLAMNIACALAAIAFVCRELQIRLPGRWFWPIAAYLLICAPTTTVLITGQFSGMLFLAITVAWSAARNGRQMTAGLWLGVLISVKPFLGLFLPALLLRREWRAAAAACVSGGACLLAGIAIFGLQAHREWLVAMSNIEWVWASMNGSLDALAARIFAPSPYYTPIVVAPALVRPLWLLGAAAVLAVTLVAARRSIDHAFATVTLGALLISPLGWVYYLWLAVPGCLALLRGRVPVTVWIALVALLVPYYAPIAWGSSRLATLTIGSAYTWATLCLWLASVSASPAHTKSPLPA
jgi:hypothetical protein